MFKTLILAALVAVSFEGEILASQGAFAAPSRVAAPSKGAFAAPSVAAATSTSNAIGSQSKGAGAGKITFNPFSVTRSSR